MQDVMAKGQRINITVSKKVFEEIERIATEEGQPVATITRFIVEKEIRQRIEKREK